MAPQTFSLEMESTDPPDQSTQPVAEKRVKAKHPKAPHPGPGASTSGAGGFAEKSKGSPKATVFVTTRARVDGATCVMPTVYGVRVPFGKCEPKRTASNQPLAG